MMAFFNFTWITQKQITQSHEGTKKNWLSGTM